MNSWCKNLELLIKSRTSLIWIRTKEEERLDKLKSNPIIPLHPSVPNFILSNLSAVKFKSSLISSNYLY